MSKQYGVVADGRRGVFYASWKRGERTLSIHSLKASWSIQGGSRVLRRGPGNQGKAFQPSDVNATIHVPGARFSHDGGDISLIARYIDGRTVELRDPSPEGLAESDASVTWPCMTADDVGKTIWIDGANGFGATESPNHEFVIPLREAGLSPLISRITAIHNANTISIERTFDVNTASRRSTRIAWGTDNTLPLLKAGAAAGRLGHRYVYFDGPGLCCAFALGNAHAWLPEPMDGVAEAFGTVIWLGRDCGSFFTDTNGSEHNKRIIPLHAPSPPQPPRNVFGGAQFQRMKRAQTVNVAVLGDSMSTDEVQPPQGASLSPMRQIIQALEDSNGGKTFNIANFSSPGATFEWIDSYPPFFLQWYDDESRPYFDYASRIPAPHGDYTAPDLVILAIGGGNDLWAINAKSIASIVRKIRALPKDQWGNPPDILMMNCRQEAFVRTLPNTNPPAAFVDFLNWQEGREFANMYLRCFAKKENIPFLDYESQAANVLQGWDPSNQGLVNVPDIEPGLSEPMSPYRLGHLVRDYACRLTIRAPDGAAAWDSVGALSFQLSAKPDNVCVVGVDAAGFLTVQVNTWGFTYEVEATIEAGSDQLRVGQPSMTDCRFWCSGAGEGGRLPRLSFDRPPQLPVGTPILLPHHRYAGIDGGALRSVITDPSYGGNYTIADNPSRTHPPLEGTILYGSMLFQPSDASSGADLVMDGAGADGGSLTTKVAEVFDMTHIRLAERARTAVRGRVRIFLGRVSTPRFVSRVQVRNDVGKNPAIEISITGTQLYVGYYRAGDKMVQTVCRTNVERFGGGFRPTIFPAAVGAAELQATRVWVDRPIFYMPTLTSDEMWGAVQSSDNDGATGGNGGNHLASDQQMRVDVPLLRAQDFCAG